MRLPPSLSFTNHLPPITPLHHHPFTHYTSPFFFICALTVLFHSLHLLSSPAFPCTFRHQLTPSHSFFASSLIFLLHPFTFFPHQLTHFPPTPLPLLSSQLTVLHLSSPAHPFLLNLFALFLQQLTFLTHSFTSLLIFLHPLTFCLQLTPTSPFPHSFISLLQFTHLSPTPFSSYTLSPYVFTSSPSSHTPSPSIFNSSLNFLTHPFLFLYQLLHPFPFFIHQFKLTFLQHPFSFLHHLLHPFPFFLHQFKLTFLLHNFPSFPHKLTFLLHPLTFFLYQLTYLPPIPLPHLSSLAPTLLHRLTHLPPTPLLIISSPAHLPPTPVIISSPSPTPFFLHQLTFLLHPFPFFLRQLTFLLHPFPFFLHQLTFLLHPFPSTNSPSSYTTSHFLTSSPSLDLLYQLLHPLTFLYQLTHLPPTPLPHLSSLAAPLQSFILFLLQLTHPHPTLPPSLFTSSLSFLLHSLHPTPSHPPSLSHLIIHLLLHSFCTFTHPPINPPSRKSKWKPIKWNYMFILFNISHIHI